MATQHSHTNCRDVNGVTVGLIDGMIAMARVLRNCDMTDPAVQEALADLRDDEDIAFVIGKQPLSQGSAS